jgi:plastocyanin
MQPKVTRSGAGAGLVIAGALLLAACGGGGAKPSAAPSSGGSSGGSATHIVISNFMFSPMKDTVSPGATISVTNKDSATHTLSSTTAGAFDTGNIKDNQTKTFKAPTKAGTYNYICNIHQYMMGTITVK